MNIDIGLVDDHQLFLKSLAMLINSFEGYSVTLEAIDGKDMLQKLAMAKTRPNILMLDVSMPLMEGDQLAENISNQYPEIKIAALSTKDDDTSIIKMIRAGCCAYLIKDIHPEELKKALAEIAAKGYYNGDAMNINYRRLLTKIHADVTLPITEKEEKFLELASSDLTYKQIADKMGLAERTVDGYRESLFQKLNVQSRVGMVMEALRRELISLK